MALYIYIKATVPKHKINSGCVEYNETCEILQNMITQLFHVIGENMIVKCSYVLCSRKSVSECGKYMSYRLTVLQW